MAQISYEEFLATEAKREARKANGGNYTNPVGFFALKNEGNEAIVRFMVDTPMDFDLVTLHEIELNGKRRKVCCVKDETHSCPLCATGNNYAKTRLFAHMLQYDIDASGRVTVSPKVWEKPASFAKILAIKLKDNGPLSDCLYKVTRSTPANSTPVNYDLGGPLSKATYPDEAFVKDTSVIGSFKAVGSIVMNKTAEELQTFVDTGAFPTTYTATPKETTYGTATAPTYTAAPTYTPANDAPAYTPATEAPTYTAATNNSGRPVRTTVNEEF